jgi:hypothetical protein
MVSKSSGLYRFNEIGGNSFRPVATRTMTFEVAGLLYLVGKRLGPGTNSPPDLVAFRHWSVTT